MDFWDLTKLLFRRWYFMVPMLLVSGLVAVYVASTAKPDYVMKGNIQLIPPVISEEDSKAGVTNTWLNLGLSSLAEAALVTLQGKSVAETLQDEGLSENFTATKEQYQSLLNLEVIAESEAQGVQTMERIAKIYDERITSLQKQQGVTDRALIQTERLDLGDNVTTSSSKLKRALVAVLGAGVLLTAAVTIGLDAWLRRRARRRTDDEGDDVAEAVVPTPVAPAQRNGSATAATPKATNGKAKGAVTFRPVTSMDDQALRVPDLASETVRINEPKRPEVKRPERPETKRGTASVVPPVSAQPNLSVEYRAADEEERPKTPDANRDAATSLIDRYEDEPTATTSVVPEDATIVLPLSSCRWSARDSSSERR